MSGEDGLVDHLLLQDRAARKRHMTEDHTALVTASKLAEYFAPVMTWLTTT